MGYFGFHVLFRANTEGSRKTFSKRRQGLGCSRASDFALNNASGFEGNCPWQILIVFLFYFNPVQLTFIKVNEAFLLSISYICANHFQPLFQNEHGCWDNSGYGQPGRQSNVATKTTSCQSSTTETPTFCITMHNASNKNTRTEKKNPRIY